MRDGHQVRFGRKAVSGMSPITGAEQTELLAGEQSADAALHTLEIRRARQRPFGDGLRQLRGLNRISLQGGGDIHPVQRVKLVKMDDVI